MSEITTKIVKSASAAYDATWQNTEDHDASIHAALTAALSALHAKAGVSVKGLEWKQWSYQRGWQADCVVGQYQVAFLGEKEVWQLAKAGKGFSDHQSSEAAKAAAQADYAARIRSALSTKLQEPVGELVTVRYEVEKNGKWHSDHPMSWGVRKNNGATVRELVVRESAEAVTYQLKAELEVLRKALTLAGNRIALLLEAYPDESDGCDHPTATRYVLSEVRAALNAEVSKS